MLFRSIIFSALAVSIVAGLVLTFIQFFFVNPIIFEAESFEQNTSTLVLDIVQSSSEHEHGSNQATDHHNPANVQEKESDYHTHDTEAWGPKDGVERSLFSALTNIITAFGFSALMLAFMTQLQSMGKTKLNAVKGLLWGVAGFIAFFAAPGLGLSPEIPGTQAADLLLRQIWWTLTVVATCLALSILVFTPFKYKLIGVLILVLPFIIGAPHIDGPEFIHPDPQAVQSLIALHHQFIINSAVANLLFWLVMGLGGGLMVNRFILKNKTTNS